MNSIPILVSKLGITIMILSKIYEILDDKNLKNTVQLFTGAFGIYLSWVIVHYIASHFYIYLCVPASILGFLASPFIATSLHCQALRWVIHEGGNSIRAMWIIFGTWFMKHLVPIPTET